MFEVHSPDFGTYILCEHCYKEEKAKFANAEFLSVAKLKEADHLNCHKCSLGTLLY
jgi:hypothetical protein